MKHQALADWLKTAKDSEIERLHTSRGHLSNISRGDRTASAALAMGLEIETGGKVTRQELRPNDYHMIWPEIANE